MASTSANGQWIGLHRMYANIHVHVTPVSSSPATHPNHMTTNTINSVSQNIILNVNLLIHNLFNCCHSCSKCLQIKFFFLGKTLETLQMLSPIKGFFIHHLI